MHLPRTLNQLICRVLIGVFLFAQLAVSSYACPGLGQPASLATMPTGAMPADCDQMDRSAANLCAEHCKMGQQNHDAAPTPVVIPPALAVLYVLPDDAGLAAETASAPAGDPILAATPPPHAILHCVLRI
ncbi:hypothetical protein [Piscinibacter terrae]|uniref:Copper resistance protein n=1 Tax=Piscinibacter terrae TaxID=2496871 RepID=A0A3N7JV92_9BURK|nr:hypothetical protein [Albitalea terrae]RQP22825.1 hypothetical protein DZC73_21280 [Albitalea terrae]